MAIQPNYSEHLPFFLRLCAAYPLFAVCCFYEYLLYVGFIDLCWDLLIFLRIHLIALIFLHL